MGHLIWRSNLVYMCAEGSGVPNLQTESNYLDLFKSYCIFSNLLSPLVSVWSLHHQCHPHIVPTLSLLSPHHLHMVLTPWRPHGHGPHTLETTWRPQGIWCCLHIVSMSSPSSPHHPHVILKVPKSPPNARYPPPTP